MSLKNNTEQDFWLKAYSNHFDVKVVTKLDLSNKNLTSLPNIISEFTSLQYLNLSHNNLNESCLSKISNKFLPNLEVLDLSHNKNLKSVGKIIHIYQDKEGKPVLQDGMVKITELNLMNTQVDYLPFLKNDEVFFKIFENLEKIQLERTPLNLSLVEGDASVTKIFKLKNLSWLNNEPIWSITNPEDRDKSFYWESRKIKYHLENDIPFDEDKKNGEKNSSNNKKLNTEIQKQKNYAEELNTLCQINLEIPPRLREVESGNISKKLLLLSVYLS